MLELSVQIYTETLKGGNCMKKFYKSPELEVTELLTEDILTASYDNDDSDSADNEVVIDGESLFG